MYIVTFTHEGVAHERGFATAREAFDFVGRLNETAVRVVWREV